MKIKICVVDDHSLYREALIESLTSINEFEIISEFPNGEDYINYLKGTNNNESDIVILDYQMPGQDGVSVCKWLKKNNRSVKPIIVSQYKDYLLIHHFIKNGAKGYLTKHSGLEELSKAIKDVYNHGFYFNDFVPNDTIIDLVVKKDIIPNFNNDIELTEREQDVAKLICRELSYKEIAIQLGISKRTVETHKNRILDKIGASKLTGIVVYATKKGWV